MKMEGEDIYCNVETFLEEDPETLNKRSSFLRRSKTENSEPVEEFEYHLIPPGSGCSRLAAMCLGLLSFLLLVCNIVLLMNYLHEKEDKVVLSQTIQILSINFTEEVNMLKSHNNNLTERITELITEKEKRQIPNDEIMKINTSNNDLNGWKKSGDNFYYISTEGKTWTDSRKFCRERGADLVIINNKEEQELIRKFGTNKVDYWIGLSDIESEGNWTWVDGTPLNTSFWRKGEPNNNKNEDCAISSLPDNLNNWNDIHCCVHYNWICEFVVMS